MNSKLISLMGLTVLVLAACSAPAVDASARTDTPDAPTPERTLPAFESPARLDEQGAVVVSVEPSNLDSPGETLDFRVGMNTHSVELDMDLGQLATLTTDSGITVDAASWDGGQGGHHVSGMLSFPAAVDGAPILEGASTLTLTLRDVDAPERVFTWELDQ